MSLHKNILCVGLLMVTTLFLSGCADWLGCCKKKSCDTKVTHKEEIIVLEETPLSQNENIDEDEK